MNELLENWNPTLKNQKLWKNEKIKVQIQWIFKEECNDLFDFDFINECFSNALLKFHGLIGSAQYTIRILQFSNTTNTCEIVLPHKQLTGFWAALSQSSNRFGTDGLIEFKIRISDINREKIETDFE